MELYYSLIADSQELFWGGGVVVAACSGRRVKLRQFLTAKRKRSGVKNAIKRLPFALFASNPLLSS